MLEKIISGGQTGVDRAALDVALHFDFPCGGWCPKGRLAEDGPIPPHYPLSETNSTQYSRRTRYNVRDSDATLILIAGNGSDRGTTLTRNIATKLNKPCICFELNNDPKPKAVLGWLKTHHVRVLNVAGPRQSSSEGIYARAVDFLTQVFLLLHAESNESKPA